MATGDEGPRGGTMDEQERRDRVRNESEALDAEAAPSASSSTTGAAEPSGVDASPTGGAVRSDEEAPAAPPSSAKS
jgi:hypothetical protein